jgi:hypothetical protein
MTRYAAACTNDALPIATMILPGFIVTSRAPNAPANGRKTHVAIPAAEIAQLRSCGPKPDSAR